ncbi:DNA methylase [Chitinophaga jiangningensis]|uniref:DNA methylase n=1 Tax=Chitinophaga jiangningensis TaxID=1419482 RepID=A0A1M6WHS5_9BACT|nr:hypothetical protein [Chitinophaga jiangningensis]SHK93267.1 DNA methylase [Chitinophaga jiangningensis]
MRSITSRVIKTESIDWRQLQFLQNDQFKDWSGLDKEKLKKSIINNSFSQPFYVWQDSAGIIFCLDGFHRSLLLTELLEDGHQIPDQLPATFIDCADRQEAAKLVLQYSSVYAKITQEGLIDFLEAFELPYDEIKFEINLPDFDPISFEGAMNHSEEEHQEKVKSSLQERFIIPPFSILDSRQGYWQDRKKKWHGLGFDSQESRENVDLISESGQAPAVYELRNEMRTVLQREPSWDEILEEARKKGIHLYGGASIFDPVLSEILYTWFTPSGGTIVDPFAGGSVRGIVAGMLNYPYYGIDLRADQVEANRRQAASIKMETQPIWYEGDSKNIQSIIPSIQADLIFSCPPYFDLEQYSSDANDLSNMSWDEFLSTYRAIIADSCKLLKDDRFACFIVGEIRDKKGNYRDFVGETVQAFRDTGLQYYNEMILINVAGSMPIRVGRQFSHYRKVGKTHQNVLVFYKGDPKAIKFNFPNVQTDLESDLPISDVEKK